MKHLKNEFLIDDNTLEIIEYLDYDDEYDETVCVCRLNNIDDIFTVIKRVMQCDDIDKYENIVNRLPYLRDYNNIDVEIDNMVNQKNNDPY